MSNEHARQPSGTDTACIETGTPVVGRVAGSTRDGRIAVTVKGGEPVPARLLATLDRVELLNDKNAGREVLLMFEEGDPSRPIIIGMLEDPLQDLVSLEVRDAESSSKRDALIDGKRLTISADNEIVLQCGEGSITIRKDGKIVVKGTHILTRSSGPNRIKGGSVSIN